MQGSDRGKSLRETKDQKYRGERTVERKRVTERGKIDERERGEN
jgi:hypothetical protein